MARKGATLQRNPGRRPRETAVAGLVGAAGLERALYLTLALDVAVAVVQLWIHQQLAATHGAYASFCNVSARVNCDVVLTSPYAMLLGLPLPVWALLKDGVLAALVAWPGRAGTGARTRGALLLVGLALWSVAFSAYMAAVAAVVLRTFCLLCAGMYVLSPVIAVLAWRLARARLGASGPLVTGPRALLGGGAIAGALAFLAATHFLAAPASLAHLTPDEVRARDPEFYRWYTGLRVVSPLPPARHVKGAADAPVTIVEFSDFECAYCAKAFRDLRDLERRHPGTVRIVFHHFPLDSSCNPHVQGRFHQAACLAAIAAECAARWGRFWEYHDRLFDAAGSLDREALVGHAVALGLDREAFATCLDDPASRAIVTDDARAGARLSVTSTPTLIINGRSVQGALERDAYEYVLALERRS
jgi:protein-disulfide isomerase